MDTTEYLLSSDNNAERLKSSIAQVQAQMDGNLIQVTESYYRELLERDNFLSALEAAGVGNWDGYEYAHEIMEEWNNEHSEENK